RRRASSACRSTTSTHGLLATPRCGRDHAHETFPMNDTPQPLPRWRLFAWLWCAGLPGVIAATAWLVPALVAQQGADVSPGVAALASGAQSALLLALAVA